MKSLQKTARFQELKELTTFNSDFISDIDSQVLLRCLLAMLQDLDERIGKIEAKLNVLPEPVNQEALESFA